MMHTIFCRSLLAIACLAAVASLTRGEDASTSKHWAFRPIQNPPIPLVERTEFVDTPVDAFIFEQLERSGLSPAPLADKRTLIRRASYDLIGLPPTPSEVQEFLADDSPDAFAKVVDRLLNSSHYGERWGRHWLDVARYANTKGDAGAADPVNPHAFTYRDYVVRSLNDDLPFDRFLVEQIAADRLGLPADSPTLAALGFITVGRRFLNNIHDTIDDRIDVVTRGTMGLTVVCARCHDHKYDPISQQDYYGLYGVFSSSHDPDPLPVVGQLDNSALPDYLAQREKLEKDRQELAQNKEAELIDRHRRLTAESLLAARLPPDPEKTKGPGNSFDDTSVVRSGTKRWRAYLEKLNRESDPIFAPWFAFVAIPESEFAARAPELAARVAKNELGPSLNVAVSQAFTGDPPADLATVAARYATVVSQAFSSDLPANAGQNALAESLKAIRQSLEAEGGPLSFPPGTLRPLFPPTIKMQLQQFGSKIDQLDATHPGAPIRAMALFDNPQPQNARIFIRGNPNNPGDETPRRFVAFLGGTNAAPFREGSGRLELARALTAPDNPLTARVIVNRVWLHHFGSGLVATPNDFGVRSEPPSHPELLDYLASRFIREGWSLKRLHRQLMLSQTYRRSSDDLLRSATIDHDNRLLSKMNRRRLDFEAMRDTLLATAGNLDRSVGGRAVDLTPAPQVAIDGRFVGSIGDKAMSRRRAVYSFIDRQNLPGQLRIFDFADPDTITGQRFSTTVPQQALYFFNNAFVMQQAVELAAHATRSTSESMTDRVLFLYQQLFQRSPTEWELRAADDFLHHEPVAPYVDHSRADQRPLTPIERYVHVLLMSDELLIID